MIGSRSQPTAIVAGPHIDGKLRIVGRSSVMSAKTGKELARHIRPPAEVYPWPEQVSQGVLDRFSKEKGPVTLTLVELVPGNLDQPLSRGNALAEMSALWMVQRDGHQWRITATTNLGQRADPVEGGRRSSAPECRTRPALRAGAPSPPGSHSDGSFKSPLRAPSTFPTASPRPAATKSSPRRGRPRSGGSPWRRSGRWADPGVLTVHVVFRSLKSDMKIPCPSF